MSPAARTTIEGFAEFAETDRIAPVAPTGRQRDSMTDAERDLDIEQRRRYLANLPTVMSPVIKVLCTQLDQLLFENSERAPGEKVHIVVQGIAGIGKTDAVLEAGRRVHNRAIAKDGRVLTTDRIKRRHVPVLYSTAPAVRSFKQLVTAMLRPFDAGANGNADALTEQLLHLLELAQTQVLIIDDAHALRGQSQASVVTADSLKAFINRIPATVVFVGTGLENSMIFGRTVGGMDDPANQLRCRMQHIEHPRYPRPSSDDPGEFVKLIAVLERTIAGVLINHRIGALTSQQTVRWMYDRTEGITARVVKWLSSASVAAVGNGERVDRQLLQATPAPGLNR